MTFGIFGGIVHKKNFEATPGVLVREQIQQLIDQDAIRTWEGQPDLDASAFDLRLGKRAWKLKEGLRPTTRELARIRANAEEVTPKEGEPFVFDRESIYLVELAHHLELPPNICGRATGRSSIGRLDIITRLLTDNCNEYDVVPEGYSGALYVLIMPQTFSFRLMPGESVNQLRLFSGSPFSSIITRDQIAHYGTPFWWFRDGNDHRSWPNQECKEEPNHSLIQDPYCHDLTVDLADPAESYVFKAKKGTKPLDLMVKGHDPTKYFEPEPIDGEERSVTLERGVFYIMKSRERLHIPDNVAVEVVAISERIGDIRIHYAGFAHPRFGRTPRKDDKRGTPLIFEVRSTDMKTKLFHETLLARVHLFRMSKLFRPKKGEEKSGPSAYEHQELKLSGYFAEWPKTKGKAKKKIAKATRKRR